jgi:membrane-bound lytic murein transglycosylase F
MGMRRKGNFPRDTQDLLGLKIMVGEGTSYEQTLQDIKEDVKDLNFTTTSEYSTEQLLEMVWKKELDCTVADSNIFTINQRYYPELSRAFVISERKSLGWILRKGDDSVENSLYEWLNIYERSGKMAETKDKYYSYLNLFDYYDTKVFYKRLKNRLPKYEKYFKKAAKQENIPWILLAAQSYQESHWNPRAKSHTGVRGMMMLTLSTAKQVGVKNRMDAVQSIFGGAKYLASIEKRFPKEIKGINRWAFTLAAYNVGMGHIHDAQVLARKLNKNPYSV